MIICVGPRDKKYYSELKQTMYNVTSCSVDFCKELSPMLLGPCNLYKGFKAKRVENAWQYSKVYAQHIDADGFPTMEYFEWAYTGWNNDWAFVILWVKELNQNIHSGKMICLVI